MPVIIWLLATRKLEDATPKITLWYPDIQRKLYDRVEGIEVKNRVDR